jgi:hypothetical protein
MYEELIKALHNVSEYDSGYAKLMHDAADAIEERDRHILTLQHEMMAEAESHIAEVNRLNKQIEELEQRLPKAPHGRLIDADTLKKILVTAIPQYSLAECTTYADSDIMRWIDEAPTIIPAESPKEET